MTCLSVNAYGQAIQQFENLRICYIGTTSKVRCFYTDPKIPSDLSKFPPKVREIHLRDLCNKSLISGLLSSKSKLGRSDLKLFYCGLPVDTSKEMAQYLDRGESEHYLLNLNRDENFSLVLDGYPKLAPFLPFLTLVNYSDLIRFFDCKIESGFFSRFVNIQKVVAGGPIDDKEQFVSFLKRCEHLFDLELKNAGLDQSTFYNQLPIHAPYLQELVIDEAQELDWKFALKLKYLEVFKTSQTASFSLIFKITHQCVRLRWFRLKFNGKLLDIFCSENLEVEIQSSGKAVQFKSKRKLVRFLKKCSIFDS